MSAPRDLQRGEVWQHCTPARQLEIRAARRLLEARAVTVQAGTTSVLAAARRRDAAVARRRRLEAELAGARAQGIADTKAYIRGARRAGHIRGADAARLLTLAETDTLAATVGVIDARDRLVVSLATGIALEDVV